MPMIQLVIIDKNLEHPKPILLLY